MKLEFTAVEQESLEELQLKHNRFLVNILQGLYSGWDEYWGHEGLLPKLRKFLSKGWEYRELGALLQDVEILLEGLADLEEGWDEEPEEDDSYFDEGGLYLKDWGRTDEG